MLANIQDFLQLMLEAGASDLHVTQESPPLIRVHGMLKPLAYPPLTANDTRTLCYIFEAAVPDNPLLRYSFAVFLHDHHPRTAHPPKPPLPEGQRVL